MYNFDPEQYLLFGVSSSTCGWVAVHRIGGRRLLG